MEKGWRVDELIKDTINALDNTIGDDDKPLSLKKALKNCRDYWVKTSTTDDDFQKSPGENRKVRKGIMGKVHMGRNDQPFCFIHTDDKQSFFCYKSDLPQDVMEGSELTFDAMPSFDKKKNKESWKAINIQHIRN